DQHPAKPGPLAAGQPAEESPDPAAIALADALQARLRQPVAERRARAVDRVRPVARLGLLSLRRRLALLARPAAAPVDRVFGRLGLVGLAGFLGLLGVRVLFGGLGFLRLLGLLGALGAIRPLGRPLTSLLRHGISIPAHAAARPPGAFKVSARETIGV